MTNAVKGDGAPTGNPYVDSLINGDKWVQEPGQPAYINYWFQSGQDPRHVVSLQPDEWTETDKSAMRKAQASWEAVANVKYVEASSADTADVWYWKDWAMGVFGASGAHGFPAAAEKPVYGKFDSATKAWTETSIQPGGYMGATLIHELGHGLGLAHPHDGGNGANPTRFPGVFGEFDLGEDGQNYEWYTVMGYNWGPNRQDYGDPKTPMAFDIAAVQALYGANMSTATGSDTYVLPSANEAGAGWSCIWDAGGSDTISAGDTDAHSEIYLEAATLEGPVAGGLVSFVDGIEGGITIAHGVTIENAIGGRGDDYIVGNDADNVLNGLAGADQLAGGGGSDTLAGADGEDTLTGGKGDDSLSGGDGADYFDGEEGSDVLNGGAGDDEEYGGAGADLLSGDGGDDAIYGEDGADTLNGGAGDDIIKGLADADGLFGGSGNDTLDGGEGMDILSGGMGNDVISGGAGGDTLLGALGNDTLNGGGATDTLAGSLGNDTMTGGAGRDVFMFNELATRANADTIADFNAAEDKIAINNQFFAKLVDGALDEKNFHIGDAAQSAKDFIIFDQATGNLWYDADGRLPTMAQQLICTLDVTGLTGTLTAGNFEII